MSESKTIDLGVVHFLITANVELVHLQNRISKLEQVLTDPLVAGNISLMARKHCREIEAALKMVEYCVHMQQQEEREQQKEKPSQLKIVDPK